MNNSFVSSTVLNRLSEDLDTLTPEARKAARYVLENPLDVGVSTVREIAEAANVKPNTFVRLARQIGFDGYDEFREPFRQQIRAGTASFPDRARWLQSLSAKGEMGALYADMVGSALRNIEETFAGIDATALQDAARTIWGARQVFTLGMGVHNANARNFSYLASTGMVQFHAIPRPGSLPSDDLALATDQDVIIAMTSKPFLRDIVEAVEMARGLGLKVIGISDSPASPIVRAADHGFVVAVDTPQFFPSSVSVIALLETLLSFVIAHAPPEIVDRVDRYHARRHAAGVYLREDE